MGFNCKQEMQIVACIALILLAGPSSAAPSQGQEQQTSGSGEYLFAPPQPHLDQHLHEQQIQNQIHHQHLHNQQQQQQQQQLHHHHHQNQQYLSQPQADFYLGQSEPLTLAFHEQQHHQSPLAAVVPVGQQSQPAAPVVGQSPSAVVQPVVQPAVGSPSSAFEAPAPSSGVEQVQHQHHVVHQHAVVPPQQASVQQGGASYYSPAGMITVVGEQQAAKPVVSAARNFEQFGQPEPASIPANYKPFGSWGLYIGGNPADGYYTNYYKALGSSVEKQVGPSVESGPVKPAVVGGQTAALSPILRQAGSSPLVGADYYPFAYSQADLSSVAHSGNAVEQVYTPSSGVAVGPVVEPVSGYVAPVGVSSYADAYATKKLGAAYASQKEVQVQGASQPGKGYQSRVYAYQPVLASAPALVQHQQQPHHHHVVAYPVPVGSQIVGSQQGVDGAFSPYGVHAFTRYAVKPTLVSSAHEPSYYYKSPSGSVELPQSYKHFYSTAGQSSGSVVPVVGANHYPFGFYGYPLSQLHYSQGSLSPVFHGETHHSAAQSPSQVVAEATSEKAESAEEKLKQQKKA